MDKRIIAAKKDVIVAGKELIKRNLIARTWGNISMRISDTQFVITPSGRSYDSLTQEDIVTVSIADLSYEGNILPSSEMGVHAKGYKYHPEVNFIIHTHQSNASALSVLGSDLNVNRLIPCAKYGLPSSKELAENVGRVIKKNKNCYGILMKNHGVLCLGKSMEDAFDIAEDLEEEAEKIYEDLTREEVLRDLDPKRDIAILPDEKAEKYLYRLRDMTCNAVLLSRSPYTKKMSDYGKKMYPYIDDLAMVAGTSVKCVKNMNSPSGIADCLNNRAAVFVRGRGAICIGVDADEAMAVATVLEKGCKAAYLAKKVGHIPPLPKRVASFERRNYVEKYSKLKEEKQNGKDSHG